MKPRVFHNDLNLPYSDSDETNNNNNISSNKIYLRVAEKPNGIPKLLMTSIENAVGYPIQCTPHVNSMEKATFD